MAAASSLSLAPSSSSFISAKSSAAALLPRFSRGALPLTVRSPHLRYGLRSDASPSRATGRYGQPEEVAGLVEFLALSPAASCITGQEPGILARALCQMDKLQYYAPFS